MLAPPEAAALQFRYEHRAFGDITDAPRPTLVITEALHPGVVLPLGSRTIAPLVGRRCNLKCRNVFQSGESMEAVSDDFDFGIELSLIGHLLKITSTATAKVGTRRIDPEGRRLDDFHYRRKGDIAFHTLNLHTQMIARRRQSYEHGATAGVGQPHTSGQDALDFDFNQLVNGRLIKTQHKSVAVHF